MNKRFCLRLTMLAAASFVPDENYIFKYFLLYQAIRDHHPIHRWSGKEDIYFADTIATDGVDQ